MRCVTCLTVFLACATQFHGTLQPVGALHAVLDPVQHQQHRDLRAFRRSLIGSKRPWIEPVSWRPRAFVYHNFLTTEEADHIIAQAKPWMKRSTVVGINGDSVQDEVRTSYGTFLARLHDPVLARVQQRVSEWTHLNISHQVSQSFFFLLAKLCRVAAFEGPGIWCMPSSLPCSASWRMHCFPTSKGKTLEPVTSRNVSMTHHFFSSFSNVNVCTHAGGHASFEIWPRPTIRRAL
jgi:hypothetical protein